MPDSPNESDRLAGIIHRGEKPPGILPRNTQAKVLGGVAVLMVLALAFSGTPPPKKDKAQTSPALPPAVEVNQARIQEYRARIEEQTRKLALEQTQLAQTKEALGLTGQQPQGVPSGYNRPGSFSSQPDAPASGTERSWKTDENKRRENESLFASNVVLSYRAEPKSEPYARLDSPLPTGRREIQEGQKLESGNPVSVLTAKTSAETPDDAAKEGTHRVMEGTFIETVLTNRLDSSFSGPVNCLVTTDIYSRDRRRILIPQGSRVLGEAQHVETFGQKRLAVAFHRLILPNGAWFSLEKFKGLNQIGETGLRDRVNNHYLQVFGVSVALGMLAGFSQANTRTGFEASGEDAYRQGVANNLSQSSLRILDRYLNVLPTFTIREGHRVKVYLTADLLLPAYSSVDEPSPL